MTGIIGKAISYTWRSATTIDNFGERTLDQNNFRINGDQSFQLPKGYKIELSGFYQSQALNGNVRIEPFYNLNFGIQKKLKNNARLTFNVNDIFNSLVFKTITEVPSEDILVARTFDFSQRTFKFTYSATFGNQKVKGSRKRNSGGAEKRRVN